MSASGSRDQSAAVAGAKAVAPPEPGQVASRRGPLPPAGRRPTPFSLHSLRGGAEAMAGARANTGPQQRLLCVSVREIMAAATARTAVPRDPRYEAQSGEEPRGCRPGPSRHVFRKHAAAAAGPQGYSPLAAVEPIARVLVRTCALTPGHAANQSRRWLVIGGGGRSGRVGAAGVVAGRFLPRSG